MKDTKLSNTYVSVTYRGDYYYYYYYYYYYLEFKVRVPPRYISFTWIWN